MKTLTSEFALNMGINLLIVVSVLVTFAVACPPKKKPSVDECGFNLKSTSIRRSVEGPPVYGVQPIGRDIYVIRDSTSYVEVYNRHNLQHNRNMSIENLEGPYDMVQSRDGAAAGSLFIASWFNAVNLTKIQLDLPEHNVEMWSFLENGLTTLGLTGSSLYTGANILVTSSTSQKIKEFTPDGSLLSEVTIRNISRPRQSIKVAPNRYAVCQGYGPPPVLHRVCLVDGNGEIIKCYGGVRGSGVGQLNIPGRLERNKKNCILVADTGNKRVVLLNQNLEYVRDLINEGLEGPYRLYLDEEQSLLYVADNTVDGGGIAVSGRVFVFQI